MALGTALVDRARVIRRVEADPDVEPVVVEGEKVMVPKEGDKFDDGVGPWFRCRIDSRQVSELQQDGRRKTVTRHTLLVGRKADIRGSDLIETKSKQMGNAKYTVDGDPSELRKRRTVIGYEVRLVKAE